ncbi:hypothetical protein [Treponema sp. R80B11-R83G3]
MKIKQGTMSEKKELKKNLSQRRKGRKGIGKKVRLGLSGMLGKACLATVLQANGKRAFCGRGFRFRF